MKKGAKRRPFSFYAVALVEPVVRGELCSQAIGHRVAISLVRVDRFHPSTPGINRDWRTLTARDQYQRGE